jgi:hypothetical protein
MEQCRCAIEDSTENTVAVFFTTQKAQGTRVMSYAQNMLLMPAAIKSLG